MLTQVEHLLDLKTCLPPAIVSCFETYNLINSVDANRTSYGKLLAEAHFEDVKRLSIIGHLSLKARPSRPAHTGRGFQTPMHVCILCVVLAAFNVGHFI